MNSLKNFFLSSEGDNWFKRNYSKLKNKKYYNDPYSEVIINLLKTTKGKINLLDIGTSDGSRLSFIRKKIKKKNIKFYGLEPSKFAIRNKKDKKIKIKLGTADKIPFQKDYFHIILFSFCLYLCDSNLLTKIINETLRVTKKNSFIVVFDFFSKKKLHYNYKHILNSKIRIMDNSKIFKSNKKIKLINEKKISYKFFYKIKNQKIDNNMLAIHTLKRL